MGTDPPPTPAVVYCKARILPAGDPGSGNEILSVQIPPTPGYTDPSGNPVTIWNVGEVAATGVADTWHDGGPGFFTVRNTGNVGAYVYVKGIARNEYTAVPPGSGWDYNGVLDHLFGAANPVWMLHPRPAPRPDPVPGEPAQYPEDVYESYHLALTTDTTALAPIWRSLDHCTYINGNQIYGERQCSAYLEFMPPGEYQPFDLKFWAPWHSMTPGWNSVFVFRVEAASFPLWEHDR